MVWSEPELSTFPVVPVEYKNLPEDMEFSAEPVSSVKLELRGPSGELRELGGNDGVARPSVVLDMRGVRPGQRTFSISIGDGNVKLPRGLRLVRAIPSEVRLEFELARSAWCPWRCVSPVKAGTDIWLPIPGFAGPDRNRGPGSHVGRIAAAMTDPVDVAGAAGTAEFRVNAFVNDAYVRFQSSSQVTVAVTMKKK